MLTEPTLDLHAFFTTSANRSDNALGPIDEALIKWAKLLAKGRASKDRIVQLLTIVKLCQDWLNNEWERARYHGANKPAVDQLLKDAWKRVSWEHYSASKVGGGFNQTELKSLEGKKALEARVSPTKFMKNPNHAGNRGKNFSNW